LIATLLTLFLVPAIYMYLSTDRKIRNEKQTDISVALIDNSADDKTIND
jgi:hypothetical protein